jgi:enediyne biosynthesis protein E4
MSGCCRPLLALLAILPLGICLTACRPDRPSVAPRRTVTVTPPAGLFEDVTERGGILFRHTNGANLTYLFLQTIGGGCAFLDYNNDGYLDVLLLSCGDFPPSPAGPSILALYHNNGDRTFTDVGARAGLTLSSGYAQSVTVGDYDNDGYPDIFVAGYGGCHLFRNEPGSHADSGASSSPLFRDVTFQAGVSDTEQGPRWAAGAAWGDYDNDGKLDLYVCHYAVWSPETDIKCPRPDGSPGYCVPTVYAGDYGRLYHNEGNGRFRDMTSRAGIDRVQGRGLAVAWLDYNDDGRQDLYIANDLDPNVLLSNNGNGTFTEVGKVAGVAYGVDGRAASGMGIALGDYDASGRESILVTNLHGEGYSLFHNEGRGLYSYASDRTGLLAATLIHSGWGIAFVDLDRDGWPDVVSANGSVHEPLVDDLAGIAYREAGGIYHNTGHGTFVDISAQGGGMTVPRAARGMAVGDFDNDGRPDILCINRNDRASLFRNTGTDNHHWLSLRLEGVRSNRDGAGARVWVTIGGKRRLSECRLGSSYASSSDKRLFFGLGGAAKADRVEIRWTTGQRDVYESVRADTFLVATEGKGYAVDPRVRP